jgi:cytochrome c5
MQKIIVSLALAGVLLGVALTAGAQERQQPQAPAAQAAPTPAPGGGAGNFGSGAAAANPFPDHPGREVVSVACTQCHGPNVFTQLRMGETAWRNQIYDMVLRGA